MNTDNMFMNPRHLITPGDRYGRGIVLSEVRIPVKSVPNGRRGALLQCSCGSIYRAAIADLRSGRQKSCGCQQRENSGKATSLRNRTNPPNRHPDFSGGVSSHPLYNRWSGMIQRCGDSNHRDYHRYGGRGISVCADWRDPGTFIHWVEDTLGLPPEGMTLDRINNSGNYEPGNVRWATAREQILNRGGDA